MHLADRALRRGIMPSYPGLDGKPVAVPEETIRHFLETLGAADGSEVPPPAEALPSASSEPPACYFPDWLRQRRAWGIAVQLYELSSARDWGMGDFADLGRVCEIAADAGADFVGLNPLHALFLAAPERCSPFSPSSRQFLNPLYIAVDHVAGFDREMVDGAELTRLRRVDLVDYQAVARLKLDALRRIWRLRRPADRDAVRDMRRNDSALERHALFEALSLHLAGEGRSAGWKDWPQAYREPASQQAKAFAESHTDDIDFHIWLQRLARDQLADADRRARGAGMRIGLYLDFAVGEAPDGSAVWSDRGLALGDVSIGAPPDVFSAMGQDWGLTPLSPVRLSDDGFRSYESLMDRAMSGAGALRLDHAMSLQQLFWIPAGQAPREGGFVRYPTAGMLDVLARLSREHQTLVIGEDLGHVPAGFREAMAASAILSYRILYFERSHGRFRPSRRWPSLAMACLSTHDLPTLKGWWHGDDIELRRDHGLIDPAAASRQQRERKAERRQLLLRLQAEALLRRGEARDLAARQGLDGAGFGSLVVAAHRFVARTPARLACMRLADAVGEEHPTNLPGTSNEYPNWRRKLAVPLEDLPSLATFRAVTAAMADERPS